MKPPRGPSDQHTRSQRHHALKGARIVFNNLSSSFDCLIRDISETGARLELDVPIGIPDTFELLFDDGSPPRQCTVTRHSGRTLRVRFTD
jgi:hypothetical protein